MEHTTLFLIFGLSFVGLLLMAFVVWGVWVRPFVKKSGARTASPYSLAALIADFSTSLIYTRGPLPWFLRLFALILILMLSDVVLVVLLLLFGI